jgi:Glycosyl hydrolase family 45
MFSRRYLWPALVALVISGVASCDSGNQGSSEGAMNGGSAGQSVAGSSAHAGQLGNGGTQQSTAGAQNSTGGSGTAGLTSSGGTASGGVNASGGAGVAGGAGANIGGASHGGSAGAGSGGASAGSGGASTAGMAGSSSTSACTNPPTPISGGSNAWASRYWDCCKPACGWKGNLKAGNPMHSCDMNDQTLSDDAATNACQSGGSAFMCWSDSPWAVCDSLSYGFAAASQANYTCGRCFQLQFDGGSHNGTANPGDKALKGKTMIVQVINNGGVAADQFDLLIPGGGVGALNACASTMQGISSQWGQGADIGSQYGGLFSECNGDISCTQQKCNSVFAGKPDLLAGCNWFLGWFGGADNPTFTFKQVACPAALTQKSGLSDPG